MKPRNDNKKKHLFQLKESWGKGFTHTLSLVSQKFPNFLRWAPKNIELQLDKLFKRSFLLSKKTPSLVCGFTVIELLVSVGIIVLITSVIVFDQKDYNDQASLINTLTDIELGIRQAQTYGVGVREFSPGTNEFNVYYGAHFSLAAGQNSTNDSYIIFADRGVSPNSAYDGTHDNTTKTCSSTAGSECYIYYQITRNNIINSICAINSGSETCAPTVAGVDIVFKRPDPAANFRFYNPAGASITLPNAVGAKIEILSPNGRIKGIKVYKTGQVAIE